MKTTHLFLNIWSQTIAMFFIVLILSSCSNSQIKNELEQLDNGEHASRGIKIIYPQNNTIFPPEFPAPSFEWEDTTGGSSEWSVFISDNQGNVLISSRSDKNIWRPNSKEWENIKKLSVSGYYSFTAIAEKRGKNLFPSCRIQFSFCKDSVGADIFYRAVTLPFSYAVKNVHTIEWYLGSVDRGKPRKMLDNLPVCGNCHSFAKDQPLLAMDVDYGNDKGSYVITESIDTSNLKPENIITWSDYKRDENEPTFGLLSQISPDGNYVLSTVKDLSIFVAVDDNLAYSQLFFPIMGIIGIYDRQNQSFDALNGANNSKYVQSNPTWSPDGKKVVFAKTEAHVNEKVREAGIALLTLDDVNEFSSGEKQFKYDLYIVDFNNGEGGEATPLKGASNNGKSNYFPKFSPDGKWIVFCQADNFMLLQPDSRLYIMPSSGGKPRLMNCNMEEMNSWHSWSPNGRWLVFSSKNRGLYTQLYLTHIDENGMDSPPVLLENLCFDKRAANIPEFYPFNGDHFKKIKDDFSNTAEYYNRGAFDKMSNNYFKRALEDLNKAVEIDSNYIESYFNRIMLNNILRQSNSKEDVADKKKAMQLVLDSLVINPEDENYLSLKISLLSNMGREDEALREAELAIKKYPNNYKFYDLLSSIYRKENKFKKAIECYEKMLKINPKKKTVLNNLIAAAYMKLNRNDEALQVVNRSLYDNPDNNDLLFIRARIMLSKKKFDLAKKDIDAVLSKDSTNYESNELLTQYYLSQGNNRLYNLQKRKTLQILNDSYNENNEDIEVIFEMASMYMSLRDFRKAENMYNLILIDFPNNYEALKQNAKIKLNMQHWSDAISIYNQLEANYPPEEEFFNNMAIACIQIGNYSKALKYFDKTIMLNPNNKDAIFNRNKLRKELDN
ncbi:tetratricopeptide repeat protein [Bacteroidota bacterium]